VEAAAIKRVQRIRLLFSKWSLDQAYPLSGLPVFAVARPVRVNHFMPTYEYLCEKCGHQFDKFQSMMDSALTVCPKDRCAQKKWGKGRVKKLISGGAGLLFKGSGFYITDYRSDKYNAAAKKDSSTPTTPVPAAGATSGAPASGGNTKPAKTPSAPARTADKSPPAAKAKS